MLFVTHFHLITLFLVFLFSFKSVYSITFRFSDQPTDVIVASGQSAIFNCVLRAEQRAAVRSTEWLKDDLLILHDSRRKLLANGSLVISEVLPRGRGRADKSTDEGRYRCRLQIRDGGRLFALVSQEAKLQVAYLADVFSMEPLDATRRLGESVSFQCNLPSVPEPATIRWFSKRETSTRFLPNPVVADNKYFAILDAGQVLEIMSVTREQLGFYFCRVNLPEKFSNNSRSSAYRKSREASLKLRQGGKGKAPVPLNFDLRPMNLEVKAGGTAELLCSANGRTSPAEADRKPTITWLAGGIVVKPSPRHSIVGSGTLRITNVQSRDKGDYTCKASLSSTEEKFEKAQLRVLSSPVFKPSLQPELRGFNQQELTITCNVHGKPPPRVTWMKNGQRMGELNSDEYFQMVGNNLRIIGLLSSDAGLYQCLASNSVGNIQGWTRLYVQPRPTEASTPTGDPISPPGTPLALKLIQVSSTDIHIEWQPPGDIPPSDSTKGGKLSYEVVWKKRGHERVRQKNTTGKGVLLDHLSPKTAYELSLYAVLRPGGVRSHYPARLDVTTLKPVATPLPVRKLQTIALSATEANVKWQHPREAGRFIQHFKILVYNMSDPQSRYIQNLTVTPSSPSSSPSDYSSIQLVNLHPFALYRVLVFAVNASGRGVTVESHVKTKEAKPSAPPKNVSVQVTGGTSASIRWLPPSIENRNGDIVTYKLRYKKKLLGKPKVESLTGEKTSFSLRNLEKNTEYLFKIRAWTAAGPGPFSNWIKFKTLEKDPDGKDYKEQAPGKVTSLDARGMSNAIVLSWYKPDKGQTRVTSYLINWGAHHDSEKQAKLPGDREEFTIRGLQSGRTYFIRLEAENKHGIGEPAYKEVRTRNVPESWMSEDEDKPSIPMNLHYELTETTTAILSWEDPDGKEASRRDGRLYELRYYPTSGLGRISPSRSSDSDSNRRIHMEGESDEENPKGTISVNVTSTRARVARLRPSTKYEFKVRTIKRSSSQRWVKSVWSFVEQFTTLEEKPGSPPQELTLTPVKDEPRSVKLAWQPPLLPNGHIENYIIYFTADRSLPTNKWVQRTVKGSQLNLKLPNLDYDLLYYYQIRAKNKQGLGPFSSIRIYKTPDDQGRDGGPVPLLKDYYDLSRVPTHNLKPDTSADTGVSPTGDGDTENVGLESGGLADKTWWAIIAAVFGAAMLLIICVIICLCRCRHNAFIVNQRRTANGYKLGNKVPTETSVDECREPQGKVTPLPPPPLKPPDLFTHRAPPGDRQHYEMERRDSESGSDSVRFQPPSSTVNGGMMASRAHVRIGSQGQPIKPKPMLLPVQDAMQPPPREPVAMVTAIGGPAGMPRGMNGVMAGPLAFHRPGPGQFTIQGGVPGAAGAAQPLPGPRVNASEIASQPSSEELQPLMSSSQISQPGPHLPPRYANDFTPHFDNATVKSSGSEKSSDSQSQSRGVRRLPSPSSSGFPGPVRSQTRHQNASSPGSGDSITSSPNFHNMDPRCRQRVFLNGKSTGSGSPFHNGPKPTGQPAAPGKTPSIRAAPVLAESHDSASEISRGYSTEKLNQEMANLEGLMKDLNAMTQKEFEC